MTTLSHTFESLCKLFEEVYGCTYDGPAIPLPYAITGGEVFKSPTGAFFTVPPPSGLDGRYESWMIEDIIARQNLVSLSTPMILANKTTLPQNNSDIPVATAKKTGIER